MKGHEQGNYFLEHPSEGKAWLKMWKKAAERGLRIIDDELIELENKINAAERKKGFQSSSEIAGPKSNIISLSDKNTITKP